MSSVKILLGPMLPRSLLAAVLLYFPSTFLTAGKVAFSSQRHFDLQTPFEDYEIGLEFVPSPSYPLPPFSSPVKTRPITVYRPRSLAVLHNARLRSLKHQESAVEQPIWDPVAVEGPDVEDMHTLAQLARMSGNAYALPGQPNWYDVDRAWNKVRSHDIRRSRSRFHHPSRAFHLAGKSPMALEDTFSYLPIIQLSCSLSKVQPFKDRHQS